MRGFLSAFGIGTASLACVVAAIFLIVISVLMNGYFGFMRLGGEVVQLTTGNLHHATVIAIGTAGAACAIDILKAFAPLFMARDYNHGNYGHMAASFVLLLVGVTLSLLSAYGLIIEQRSGFKSSRVAKLETKISLETQLKAAHQRIQQIGFVRPVTTIKAELAGQRQHRRWSRTKGCTDATSSKSRTFCTAYNQLQGELGQSQALASERQQVTAVNKKLAEIRDAGGVKAPDPQLDSLSEFMGWKTAKMETIVLMLIAGAIEFGSAFGLYFALHHGAKKPVNEAASAMSSPVAATPDIPRPDANVVDAELIEVSPRPGPELLPPPIQAIDVIVDYAAARLRQVEGSEIPLADLYADLKDWREQSGEAPMSQQVFNNTMLEIAEQDEEIKIGVRKRKRILLDAAFRQQRKAA